MAMDEKKATDHVREEIHRALDRVRHDLSRVDILTAALAAFSRPIPDYEPSFHHMHLATRGVREFKHSG
jgi:hypothetical protein